MDCGGDRFVVESEPEPHDAHVELVHAGNVVEDLLPKNPKQPELEERCRVAESGRLGQREVVVRGGDIGAEIHILVGRRGLVAPELDELRCEELVGLGQVGDAVVERLERSVGNEGPEQLDVGNEGARAGTLDGRPW